MYHQKPAANKTAMKQYNTKNPWFPTAEKID